MKILFIGDIVGEPGRKAVSLLLPVLKALKLQRGLRLEVLATPVNAAAGWLFVIVIV